MNNEPVRGIKFLIFDVDGTIAAYQSSELWRMPMSFFEKIGYMENKPLIAFASNQGGVGMRYWMESKEWGDPSKYPTEEQVRQRMHLLSSSVERLTGVSVDVYLSFMYQSTKGNWSPIKANQSEWQKSSRKPAPGMLIKAMTLVSMLGDQTLMVGDSPEDREAAERANCNFMLASDFFFSDVGFDPTSVLY